MMSLFLLVVTVYPYSICVNVDFVRFEYVHEPS